MGYLEFRFEFLILGFRVFCTSLIWIMRVCISPVLNIGMSLILVLGEREKPNCMNALNLCHVVGNNYHHRIEGTNNLPTQQRSKNEKKKAFEKMIYT